MAIRGDWATNEVLTSDDLNDTVNDKVSVSALGTALPLDVDGTTASAGTATDISRVDHRHFLGTHTHAGATTGGNIPQTSVTDMTTAWTTHVPAWNGYYSGWSVGNGYTNCAYKRYGKTYFWTGDVGFGSTSTFGTGSLSFAMPIDLKADYRYQVGAAILNDGSSSNRYILTAEAYWDGFDSLIYFHYDGGLVTATYPITLAANDYIAWSGVFEAYTAS